MLMTGLPVLIIKKPFNACTAEKPRVSTVKVTNPRQLVFLNRENPPAARLQPPPAHFYSARHCRRARKPIVDDMSGNDQPHCKRQENQLIPAPYFFGNQQYHSACEKQPGRQPVV